jgi:bifunctional non-homologous end joining protein LigD
MPTTSSVAPSNLRLASGLPCIQPLTLVPWTDPFDDPEWLFEPKYDGLRGVLYSSSLGCEIRSARDQRLDRFSELWGRVARVLRGREAILDGEIVSLDRHGKPGLQELHRGQGFLAFAAFDLVWLDGQDLRTHSLSRRKALLAELLPEDTGPLYKILTIEEHGRALYGAVKRMDLEGIVGKRIDEPYAPTSAWYKIGNPAYPHHHAQAELFQPTRRPQRAGRDG